MGQTLGESEKRMKCVKLKRKQKSVHFPETFSIQSSVLPFHVQEASLNESFLVLGGILWPSYKVS